MAATCRAKSGPESGETKFLKLGLNHVNQRFNENKIENIPVFFPNLGQVKHLKAYLRDVCSFWLLSLLITVMFMRNQLARKMAAEMREATCAGTQTSKALLLLSLFYECNTHFDYIFVMYYT